MTSKSAQINAEIYNLAPALYEAVRSQVIELATAAPSKREHEENKATLDAAISKVMNDAIPKELDHRGFWQMIWPRITYAGTRSRKANEEIPTMRALVPLFRDLDNYAPGRYVFDKIEWNEFVGSWKARFDKDWQKVRWLELSKSSPDWNPSKYFANARTSPEVWQMLVKDDKGYPGLRFSAKVDKVEKYLDVAAFLYAHRAAGTKSPLDHYLQGHTFVDEHLTGPQWVDERHVLKQVRERLARQVGRLTALHTMMDLGLKTIKPDRVLAYLFSQMGWLQTLPATKSKEQVMKVYIDEDVVEEMTIRADVFAAALSKAGHPQAHRLLDIWLVKFGQEPEQNEFGITVNLQAKNGIKSVIDDVRRQSSKEQISASEAARRWPTREFTEIKTAVSGKKRRVQARMPRLADKETERRFMDQWRHGFAAQPHIYPRHIDNQPKTEILKRIALHWDPEEAFLSVLLPDEDDDQRDLAPV